MRKVSNVFIIFFLLPLVFSGCASPGKNSAEVFVPRTANEEAQLQVSDFILGVGDSVDIAVWRNDDLKTSVKISPTGKIMFPLIGEVQAAGKGITVLKKELTERFSKYLVDPQVTIAVTGIQSRKILILGEVKNPGIVPLDMNLTIVDSMAKAGGWTTDANMNNVLVIRNVSGKVKVQSFDIESAMGGGSWDSNLLQMNDIVYVPTKKIADISRFMSYIGNILSPVVMAEGGIVLWPQMLDALRGRSSGSIAIPTH